MTPVALITPPSIFLADERVFISLGILKVAAALEARGHAVEVLDLSGIANYEEALADFLARTQAKAIGITATTPQMPAVARIVRCIREAGDYRIILGGPHPTLVHASVARGRRRALPAWAQLQQMADVIVAGDGEDAIEVALAPDAPAVINADDPKGSLFLTSAALDKTPWPARHLVDLASYHYTIDGERATSLIAQLGCLAAGTMIDFADGRQVAIEDVRAGDVVVSWDAGAGKLVEAPVAAAWSRQADDLWRVCLVSGECILVTSEHPLWTEHGWKRVVDLDDSDRIGLVPEVRRPPGQGGDQVLQQYLPAQARIAGVSDVQQKVRDTPSPGAQNQLLLVRMPGAVDDGPAGETWADRCCARSDAREVGGNDAGRAQSQVEHQGANGERCDATGAAAVVRDQARRLESDEAARGGREGVGYGEGAMERLPVREDEASVARWEDGRDARAEHAGSDAQSGRAEIGSHSGGACPDVHLRRERRVLDRALRVGEAAQPGLPGTEDQASDPDARRVLASGSVGGHRDSGLRGEGMAGAGSLVEGATDQEEAPAASEDSGLRFAAVASRTWIGPSTVYNITVCPGHSYVANGVVVHNCPFGCNFCGGRASPMLRRVRTRSTGNILAEVEFLHRAYGYRAAMLYDDEINVSRTMLDLMRGLADQQSRLGVDYRLRGFIKAELFTAEQAQAMYAAGFRWILTGFESGSPRILRNIEKRATVEDNDRCMDLARSAGLKVKALMSLGHAGETPETVAETQDWLLRVRPEDFDCTVITPYPGAPYYDDALPAADVAGAHLGVWTFTAKSGDRLYGHEVDYSTTAEFYKGMPGEYVSHVWTDAMTAPDLVVARDALEAEVRAKLGLPYNVCRAAIRYEHSMGQSGPLPPILYRASEVVDAT